MTPKTRQDCEAMLTKSGFAQHKDSKGKVNADNFVADAGDRRQVVSWSPKAAKVVGRDLTVDEARRGVVYTINAEGEVDASPEKQTPAGQAYVAWADKEASPVASSGMVAQQAPAKQTTEIVPAKSQVLAPSGKEFMQGVKDTPQELAITLGDKRYATKNGRWYALHMSGRRVRSCKPEILQTPYQKGDNLQFMPGSAVVLCTLVLDNGTPEGEVYQALGEASPENTSSMIYGEKPIFDKKTGQKIGVQKVNNLLHMAETKAVNRALGMATAGGWFIGNNTPQYDMKHVEGCSAEELPDFEGIPGEQE